MAKKITPENTEEKEIAADTDTAQNQNTEEVKQTPPSSPKQKGASTEIPEYAHAKLKMYSGHKTLYIDSHGGTYTSNTPEKIRGNAVLYENPYHKL
jgi:hypothetical protein